MGRKNNKKTLENDNPTQKPVTLIKELLEASAQPSDTILDCFMGCGSTIKGVKEFGDLYYIGIEIDEEMFEKAKAYIEEAPDGIRT
ncbi:MAG: DNA methyltransferase [Promethearchaeota archaeon]